MSLIGMIIVYILVWWSIFFMILPFGIKGVWEDEADHGKGVDQGAPVNPNLKKKALMTTWVSAIVSLIIILIIKSGIISYSS